MDRQQPGQPPTVEDQFRKWECERGLERSTRKAVYVSTPISTGRAFVRWYAREGNVLEGTPEYERALRADVILPNIQRMARFIEVHRWQYSGLVIDPTTLDVAGWTQPDYHAFWQSVLERHARRVLFLDGWELSRGCTLEFLAAQELDLECVNMALERISLSRGIQLIESGLSEARACGVTVPGILEVLEKLRSKLDVRASPRRLLYKDEILDHVAATANVAQFVSFGPGADLPQRFSRVLGFPANHRFESPEDAVRALLESSPEKTVNIRTYYPERPENNPFEMYLANVDQVMARLREFAGRDGLHTIVNESIDQHDGGVSGVAHKGALEFAPDATPRCVDDEEIQTALLPFELGLKVLETVYGFEPDLVAWDGARVEFSIHPKPRGWLREHTVIWQAEQQPVPRLDIEVRWPNAFSRFLGDKAFGLLVAAAADLPVPRTTVFTRRLFPFTFGTPTGSAERWLRTCPREKEPGFYPTVPRWEDPYAVLDHWRTLDAAGQETQSASAKRPAPLVSVLFQEGVPPEYAGRLLPVEDGLEISGVAGFGGRFMRGEVPEEKLPDMVLNAVESLHGRVRERFGAASVEWVFDGHQAWVVQVNSLPGSLAARRVDSHVTEWQEFVYDGDALDRFREAVARLAGAGKGIRVIGNVSPLSHAGEIADLYGVPADFVRPESA